MKIEAIDLQSALTEASRSLECSVMDLEYEIIQHPRKGFFGLEEKAIIEAKAKKDFEKILKKDYKFKNHKPETHEPKQENKIEIKNEKIKVKKKNTQ